MATVPVENDGVRKIIQVENFKKAILQQLILTVEEPDDQVIVWKTLPSRLTAFLGEVMTLDLPSLDFVNIQNIHLPTENVTRSVNHYHHMEFLSKDEKEIVQRSQKRDNFGAKVTSNDGRTNNLRLLFFRLILTNFEAMARNPPSSQKGRKQRTILENVLCCNFAKSEQITERGHAFHIFFSTGADLTEFKKNFKKNMLNGMGDIDNWLTNEISARWGGLRDVARLAIKNTAAWDSMIMQVKANENGPISNLPDEPITAMWDTCDDGVLQAQFVNSIDGGNNQWSRATESFGRGIITPTLVDRLVSVREQWVWARIQIAHEGSFQVQMSNRLGVDENALMLGLLNYVPSEHHVDRIF